MTDQPPDDPAKHKTVGISLAPALRTRAAERARAVGLSFSRYVALCIEAELDARAPQLLFDGLPAPAPDSNTRDPLDLDEAISRGHEYAQAKALSINFENDIEEILRDEDYCYTRSEQVGPLRTDFLIQWRDQRTDTPRRIALECKYNIRNRYTVTLGQAVILKSLPDVDDAVVCVPYLKHFDTNMRRAFEAQGIALATPDTLVSTLQQKLEATPENKS